MWQNFCKFIGRPDLDRFAFQPDHFVRAANADELHARDELEAIISSQNRDEWHALLVQADVCVGKVYEPQEVPTDPQVQARDMITNVEHPLYGSIEQFGIPIKLTATSGSIRWAAPAIGEHTEQVLSELGITAGEIAALRERNIIA